MESYTMCIDNFEFMPVMFMNLNILFKIVRFILCEVTQLLGVFNIWGKNFFRFRTLRIYLKLSLYNTMIRKVGPDCGCSELCAQVGENPIGSRFHCR